MFISKITAMSHRHPLWRLVDVAVVNEDRDGGVAAIAHGREVGAEAAAGHLLILRAGWDGGCNGNGCR